MLCCTYETNAALQTNYISVLRKILKTVFIHRQHACLSRKSQEIISPYCVWQCRIQGQPVTMSNIRCSQNSQSCSRWTITIDCRQVLQRRKNYSEISKTMERCDEEPAFNRGEQLRCTKVLNILSYLKRNNAMGNSLLVQWLELCPFTAEELGSIHGWGTQIPKGAAKE